MVEVVALFTVRCTSVNLKWVIDRWLISKYGTTGLLGDNPSMSSTLYITCMQKMHSQFEFRYIQDTKNGNYIATSVYYKTLFMRLWNTQPGIVNTAISSRLSLVLCRHIATWKLVIGNCSSLMAAFEDNFFLLSHHIKNRHNMLGNVWISM